MQKISSNFFLQVRIRACDTAWPNNCAEDTLTITVPRNANSPVFTSRNIVYTISDAFPSGNIVGNLTATDADGVSCCPLCLYECKECRRQR